MKIDSASLVLNPAQGTAIYSWAQFGGGYGGYNIPFPHTFFSSGFLFGEVPKLN